MSDAHTKSPREESHHNDNITLTGNTSPGVRRIEAISKHIRPADRWVLFFAVFLIAYAYGLDGTLRYVYQVWFGTSRPRETFA